VASFQPATAVQSIFFELSDEWFRYSLAVLTALSIAALVQLPIESAQSRSRRYS